MSLATLWRPQKLSEVIGQPFITTILEHELETHTTKQAYLFIGPGGCGKSSTAQILSNELNGHIVSIDAASNNTAEDMRKLLSSVSNKPIGKDKTVVVLEEIQALGKQALDVLLLTLEQPPSHLVFIMCTTEGDKIPVTIKSRCETFYVNPVDETIIAKRLEDICKAEKFPYEFDALVAIGKYAKGSVRMAISYLEQISSDVTMGSVTKNIIRGTIDTYFNIIYAVIDKDVKVISGELNKVENAEKFCQELFIFILNVSVYFKTDDIELAKLPKVIKSELDVNFGDSEKESIDKLLKRMYDLQYKIKKSPTAREELLACLILTIGEIS
jgi:DNA polymerase-3 subunit gamma/tau